MTFWPLSITSPSAMVRFAVLMSVVVAETTGTAMIPSTNPSASELAWRSELNSPVGSLPGVRLTFPKALIWTLVPRLTD